MTFWYPAKFVDLSCAYKVKYVGFHRFTCHLFEKCIQFPGLCLEINDIRGSDKIINAQ